MHVRAVQHLEDIEDTPVSKNTIRALIVDDSKLQRRILSASLQRMGYQVKEADSGTAALEVCDAWPPDIVLSDWMMPEMDGLEFCSAFKAMQREQYGYFILLTSKSAKDEVAEGLQSGADDFLSKPVNGLELRARLAAGERIIHMQRELINKTTVLTDTLGKLREVHDSLNSDLIEAKKLQQSLIREKHRKFENAALSFILRPAGHVGGDLVGYFPISKSQVGFFAIDVSGHGVSSALMTARLAGYLTSSSPEHNIALGLAADGSVTSRCPSDVITELNRIVLEEMETDHYFTVILAIADMETGKINLCQAGHPHPLVRRRDGTIEQDGTGGLPVGLFPAAEFEDFQIELKKGDQLILASDGITECPNVNDQMLGEEGFENMIKTLSGAKGTQLLETLVWMLSEYADDTGFPDDVSAVLYEFRP